MMLTHLTERGMQATEASTSGADEPQAESSMPGEHALMSGQAHVLTQLQQHDLSLTLMQLRALLLVPSHP